MISLAEIPKKAEGGHAAWLDDPSLFVRWRDPVSGVESFILQARVAPFQQSFYYVNPSLSQNGRYYWFYCAFPPASARSLAVLDLVDGTLRHFPESQFIEASPCVDESTGQVYWSNEKGIWALSPSAGSRPELVNRFAPDFQGNRTVYRYATHHTFSPDRKALNIDAEVGNDLYLGHAPLNGDPIVIWQTLEPGFNHAQFNPVDENLQLIAQDHYMDRATWKIRFYEIRLWLIRKGGVLRPVYPEKSKGDYEAVLPTGHHLIPESRRVTDCRNMHGHEWWGRDGKHIWYMHYGRGVERLKLGETSPELIWPHTIMSHAHADRNELFLTADIVPPDDPYNRQVLFRNLTTEKTVEIVSHMPEVPDFIRTYHVHPHPQFCLNDSLICYTTLVRGKADIAFVRVADLIERTKK